MVRRRKITQKDREIFRRNALKGTKKWMRTSTGARRAERNRHAHGWGFEGKSPRTRKRTYKIKR